jgi:hypothetical protein
MKLISKLKVVLLVINFMFPLAESSKIERSCRKIEQAHHKTQIPLRVKKSGCRVAHSFIAFVTMY